MSKIIVFNLISLDGYFAGPKGEIDWHHTDEEFGQFANEQTPTLGTLIFGRVTYEMMASFWPTPEAVKSDPIVAHVLNTAPKIVFSKTLTVKETPVWKNVRLFKEIDPVEIEKVKKEEDGLMTILGSGTIVQQFANLGLIDEYRLMVNPVILGKGKCLFEGVKKHDLVLLKTRIFTNGNILLYYSIK